MKGLGRILPILVLIAAGCASKPEDQATVIASCPQIQSDQWDSFTPRPNVEQSIQVNLDSSFSSVQQDAIRQAAGVWNSYAQSTIGRDFFVVQVASIGPGSVPSTKDDCGFSAGGDNAVEVINVASREAGANLGITEATTTNTNGITIRCSANSSLDKQAILLNTFSKNMTVQFMSVALHELGHALGLNHSCQKGTGTEHWAGCDNLGGGSNPYYQAVMYPTLPMLGGDVPSGAAASAFVKEQLRANDVARANCLYQGL